MASSHYFDFTFIYILKKYDQKPLEHSNNNQAITPSQSFDSIIFLCPLKNAEEETIVKADKIQTRG